MAKRVISLAFMALITSCYIATASEPKPLQDFCVADFNTGVRTNGVTCKDPTQVEANDFFFSGLHLAGNTATPTGSTVKPVTVAQIPGLNTLGISMVRIDYAPGGVIAPHYHPRASEILVVVEGSIEAGFVTSNPENRKISKILNKGDVFVFPIGMVHFQRNIGKTNAVAFAGLSSQNPGVVTIANAVFGSNPDIEGAVLAKAFQVDINTVSQIQAKF